MKLFSFCKGIPAALLLLSGCSLFNPLSDEDSGGESSGTGALSFKFFDGENYSVTKASSAAAAAKIDTNSFILSVTASQDGTVIYNGPYCECPEVLDVEPGTYVVNVESAAFKIPSFDTIQWGDEQIINVEKGRSTRVELLCSQKNCGVKLDYESAFLDEFPDATMWLRSSEGSLMYGYRENRTAYFLPGAVKLVMSREGSGDSVLKQYYLCSGEMLMLKLRSSATSGSGSGSGSDSGETFTIKIDTTRNYISETYIFGETSSGSSRGSSAENPLGVGEVSSYIGSTVWVGGYIVGGDLTSKGISFEAPFSSATCLAIASRKSTTTRSSCLSVELPSGAVRDALNLRDHPELLGQHVCLKGTINSSYYSLTGIKNVTDYVVQ